MRSDNWHESGAAAGRDDAAEIDAMLECAREALRRCGPFEAADLVRRERERTSDGGAGR